MKKEIGFDKITLGVCYYPEHWDRSLWEDDLRRMKECGIEIIRIAEFAWNILEPREGEYSFAFFDEFMALAEKEAMKVIFCTPTATPPAWLTNKYPEVLNASCDGKLYRHGMRRHYNYNSEVYNSLTSKIVRELAVRYGHHPSVIGWQIDNELNCEVNEFYSESDHTAFRRYLQETYGTLEALNKAWGTNFWSQEYSDWDQVYLRRPNVSNSSNPHLALDEKRFISASCIRFCKLQADILREHIAPGQFITTNGLFGHIDYQEMTGQALDFITYDSYPNFGLSAGNTDGLRDRKWSFHLSRARSICPTFGIMEQQSGPNGWVERMAAPSPEPGQMRLWTFQSVAHGADYVGYFRWRTCGYGTEIYWHGLNDQCNIPNRRIGELKQIHGEIEHMRDAAGAKYRASFALLRDYSNEWDGEMDTWHGPLTRQSERAWFAASTFSHTPMDIVCLVKDTALQELCAYKMLVYPHAAILSDQTAGLLAAYVKQGGVLVTGARTGYKDEHGQCPMRLAPGFAAPVCGVRVSDFTMLGPYSPKVTMRGDTEYEPALFLDILEPEGADAEVIAAYSGGYMDGKHAIVENRLGSGRALYFGSAFTQDSAEKLLDRYGLKSPYDQLLTLPECCELAVREKNGKEYFFVLSYSREKAEIGLSSPMTDLLTGREISGSHTLDGYDVLVLIK